MADKDLAEFENDNDFFMDIVDEAEAEIAANEPEESEDDEDSSDDETADSEDDLEDEEEDEEEADDEDEDDEDESEEEGKDKRTSKEVAPKKNKLTLDDGSQIEVLDTASIKMKVDGKFKRVSIRELRDNYNGEIKHDEMIRRSADAEKKALESVAKVKAEEQRVVERVKSISSAITEGNIMEALAVIGQMQGEDAEEIIDKWTAGMTDFLTEFESMTPEQKEAKVRRFKLEQETRDLEARRNKLKNQEELEKVEKAIAATCEEHSLSREEFNDAFDALLAKNKEIEAQGGKPVDFGLSHVVDLAGEYRIYEKILDASEELEVKLEPSDHNYLIQVLRADEKRNGGRLPDGDYVELIKAYAQEQADDLSRNVGAKKAKTSPKSRKKKTKIKEISRMSELWE